MKKLFAFIPMMLSVATPSYAALDVGDAAPNFTASAALGGKVYKFNLADSLAKGPVVLYFFPAAFSVGCSIEAHEFAESIPKFEALGATVIGVSSDDIATLGKFSVQACQGKFPVASDDNQAAMKSYDAVMALVAILVLDGLWLGLIAKDLYKREMGSLMAEQVRVLPVIVFYALYPAALVYLTLMAPPSGWPEAALRGAILDLAAYGAYDLTN